jgi:hypothetical protein
MHKITRTALAIINGLAQFGANVRAYLLSLHINALTALVNKADEEAQAAHRAVDRMQDRAYAASINAGDVARKAAEEAAKHGVSLEV